MFLPRQRVWPRLGLTRNLRITSAFVGLNSFISGQTETVGSGPTYGSGIQSEDSCEMKCEIGKIDDDRAARIRPPLSRPQRNRAWILSTFKSKTTPKIGLRVLGSSTIFSVSLLKCGPCSRDILTAESERLITMAGLLT